MLKDLPNQRSTTKESEVPTRINIVDTTDQIGPSSAFGSKASVVHKNVPSTAEIRGSMPLDFCTGTSRVIAVAATRLRKSTLAILAASMSSLWMLSNGSRRGISATAITTSAVKTTTTVALAVQSSQRLAVNSTAILSPSDRSVSSSLLSVIVSISCVGEGGLASPCV